MTNDILYAIHKYYLLNTIDCWSFKKNSSICKTIPLLNNYYTDMPIFIHFRYINSNVAQYSRRNASVRLYLYNTVFWFIITTQVWWWVARLDFYLFIVAKVTNIFHLGKSHYQHKILFGCMYNILLYIHCILRIFRLFFYLLSFFNGPFYPLLPYIHLSSYLQLKK